MWVQRVWTLRDETVGNEPHVEVLMKPFRHPGGCSLKGPIIYPGTMHDAHRNWFAPTELHLLLLAIPLDSSLYVTTGKHEGGRSA